MKRLFGSNVSLMGAAAIISFAASSLPAAAGPELLGVDYTQAPGSSLCNQTACVGGYQFTVGTAGITVQALGAFDGSQGNPSNGGKVSNLANSETIDLFDSTGAVLATTAVGDGVGTQVGSWFAFNNLSTPVSLKAGTYIVAALLSLNDNSSFPAPSPSVGSGITFVQLEYCGSNVTNPPSNANGSCGLNTADFLSTTNTSQGFLGGNIEYTTGSSGGGGDTPVPEPASLLLLGAGLFGLGFARRRRA